MEGNRKKLAIIRKNDLRSCPFGLPIPFGCKYAGTIIDHLAPFKMFSNDTSKDEKVEISSANTKLLAWNLLKNKGETLECPYAQHIMEGKNGVDCNYEDNAPGQKQDKVLNAAPFYSQVFSGTALNGLYSYPIGYYADYNISRNLYFGVNSLQGEKDNNELIKLAAEIIALDVLIKKNS